MATISGKRNRYNEKMIYWAARLVLVLCVALSNPIVAGMILTKDRQIDSYSAIIILWGTALFFTVLLYMSVFWPEKFIRYIKSNWKNYLLSAFSLILALAIAEIGIRLFIPYKAIDGLRRDILVKSYEFSYRVLLNSSYFRDNEFRLQKTPGEFRAFLIGDSVVFGAAVEQEDTIDKHLENVIKKGSGIKTQVFNLGRPGGGIIDYFYIAKQFKRYQPDVVIVGFYVDNDVVIFRDFLRCSLRIAGVWQTIDTQLLNLFWRKKFDVDPFYKEKFRDNEINPWLFLRAGAGDNQEYYNQLAKIFESYPKTKEYILAIKNLYKDVPFYLVLIPSKYQVSEKYFPEMRKIGFVFKEDKVVDDALQKAIISWAKASGINGIDILPYMLKSNDKEALFYRIDDHPAAEGNEIIADVIYNRLKEDKVIPAGN